MTYTMKGEPIGTLNLNAEDSKRLDLESLDPLKIKRIFACELSKPTSLIEETLTSMQVPTIQRSEAVYLIDSSPPDL